MGLSAVPCLLVLVTLAGPTTSQVPEGCLDPPENNDVAGLIVAGLEAARDQFTTGFPSLGIPPLDPLGPFPHIPFHVDTDNVRLDGSVNDTLILNLSQFIVCSLNFSLGVSQKLDMEFRLHDFHIEGVYLVDGLAYSLLPIFGDGTFTLDAYDAGFTGGGKLVYNPITDRATIKDLHIDIYFSDLELVMECILGCGDMADLINGLVSDIGPAIFSAVWDIIDPILTSGLENGINNILKNISISDIITPERSLAQDMGNANGFVDLVMTEVDQAVLSLGLDPAPLPDTTLSLGQGSAEVYSGQVRGLSTLHRDGTCTLDPVAGWIFLYANIAVEQLKVEFLGDVSSGASESSGVVISAAVERVSVYMVARQDIFLHRTDIDQFIITEFGHIDVSTEGLGLLGHMAGALGEAVANLVREDITNLLEGTIKDIIQEALNETPWP